MAVPANHDQIHSITVASCHLCHVWALQNKTFIVFCLQASNYSARLIFILATELYDFAR